MVLPIWTVLVGTFALMWFFQRRNRRTDKLAKINWPLIGNLLDMMVDYPNDKACEWSRKCGSTKRKLGRAHRLSSRIRNFARRFSQPIRPSQGAQQTFQSSKFQCAMQDWEFHGYLIEKGDIIQPNLYYIHHDPKFWRDPDNFLLERFLSEDGTKYVKNENLQTFQIGRRQCVGETLARDSLFLYVTNLFQQFEMKFNSAEPEPKGEAAPSFSRNPKPYTVVMTNRLKN